MAEAAFINNNAVWPSSDVSSTDHKCHALNAVASVRRLGDDTPGQCGRHDNSPRWQRERRRTLFGPIQLAIVVAATHIRSAGAIQWLGRVLSFGQSTSPPPASCPLP